jgi:hypothetical protein
LQSNLSPEKAVSDDVLVIHTLKCFIAITYKQGNLFIFSFQYNRGSDSLLIVGSDQEIFTSLYTFDLFVYFGQSTTSYYYLEVAHPISCPASRIWFETSKSDHFMVFLLFFRTIWLPLHLSDHFQTVCCTLCRTVKIFRNIFPLNSQIN